MEHEQIQKICRETTDKNYQVFLCNEGWKYKSEEEALSGYARLKKSSDGIPLSWEEFLAELSATENDQLAKQLYSQLFPLVKKGAITALELYHYARFKWCRNHPEAVAAYQTGPKQWAVNNCDNEIAEDRAKLLVNSEWGFEASRIKVLGTPYYDATDWNFICFRCGPYDWLMRNGELYQIFQ